MFLFFDFLYVSVYKVCENIYGKKPASDASSIISVIQGFSILSVFMLIEILIRNREELTIPKLIAGIVIVVLMLLNYIRYQRFSKFSYESIESKWEQKSLKYRQVHQILQVIFVASSVGLFIGLIIYFASRKM